MKGFLKIITLMIAVIMMAGMVSTGVLAEKVVVVDPSEKGTIIIHKYDQATWTDGSAGDGTQVSPPQGAEGLNGVIFEAYKVGDNVKTIQDARNYIDANNVTPIRKTTTTHGTYGKGTAVFDDLDQGIYLIVEIASGGIISVISPFLVKLPMTNAAGDSLMLTVHAYPKNTMLYINKTIVDGNDNVSTKPANIGDTVTWCIEPAIPADIGSMDIDEGYYRITDTLDPRLDLENVVVKLGGTELSEGTDYTLNTTTDANGTTITVNFNKQTGIDKLAAAHSANQKLEIFVETTINSTAAHDLDREIVNSAKLLYKNDGDEIPVEPPTDPKVIVTGLSLVKYDKDNENLYLPNATFDLYWSATGAEGTYEKVGTATTDADGMIYWEFEVTEDSGLGTDGVGYGYFYVLETKAPEGYELLGQISDVIRLHSDNPNGTWKLANSAKPGFNLPTTGGMGTLLYTIAGLALIGGAAAIFIASRKKKADGSK